MLKAMLCVEDITETGVNLTPSNSFTVQEFHYDYGRRRDAMGRPYGPTESAYMDFTVKVSSDESAKVFFERMKENDPYAYSILFDVYFKNMSQLSNYEDAMVARGYLVEVEEMFDKTPQADLMVGQMLIHAKLLLTNITYVGVESNLKLQIVTD